MCICDKPTRLNKCAKCVILKKNEIIHYYCFDKNAATHSLCIGERFKHNIVTDDGFHQLPKKQKNIKSSTKLSECLTKNVFTFVNKPKSNMAICEP